MAYRADIEIAVRGAQELKRLQNEIKSSSDAVNSLNSSLNAVANLLPRSFNNLNRLVSEAATEFNKVALGTQEATDAARLYARATDELNAGLRERVQLLKQVREEDRKARLAASGIREATQYAGPIGPGQASPVALRSELRGRTQQILDERKGRAELNAVLQDQFEVERQLQNSKLDQKAAQVQAELDKQAAAAAESAAQVNKLTARQEDFIRRTDAAAQAAARQTAEFYRQARAAKEVAKINAVAGPAQLLLAPAAPGAPAMGGGARRRITGAVERLGGARTADEAAATLRLAQATDALVQSSSKIDPQYNRFLPDTAALNAVGRGIKRLTTNQEEFNQTVQRGIRFEEKYNQELERRQRLGIGGPVSNRMPGTTGVTRGPFPVEGPIPLSDFGRREVAQSRGAGLGNRVGGAISGSIIGGAFPLLFGQGAGAATGGAIGGLVGGLAGPGGSFAGSLLGTLLGDIASRGQSVKQLGEDLGFSATQAKTLADAFKTANTDVEKFTAVVQNIRGVGLELEEQATAVQLVTALTEKYGGSFEKVGNAITSALESGKVSQAVLNQLTSQGITVQDALAAKYDVSRDKILEMAKKGEVSVQSLLDTLVELGNASTTAAEKTQTPFEKALSTTGQLFQSFWKDVQTIFAGVSSSGVDAATALINIFNKLLQEVLFPLGRLLARIAALFVDVVSTGVRAAAELINGFRGLASAVADSLMGIVNMIPGLRTIVGLARQLFKGVTGSKSSDWNDMPWPEGIPKPGSPGMIGRIMAPSQAAPSGAAAGAGKQPPKDRTAALLADLQAITEIGRTEDLVRDLLFQGRDILAAEVELTKTLADIERDRVKQLEQANYQSEKDAINKIAAARALNAQQAVSDKIRELNSARFNEELRAQQAVRDSVRVFTDLRKEQELQAQYSKTYLRLVTEGMLPAEAERIANFEKLVAQQVSAIEEQIKITDLAILEAKARGANTVELEKQLKLFKDQEKAIKGEAAKGPGEGAKPGDRIKEAVATARGELNELIDLENQVIAAAAAIGDAFQQAFRGLVTGAMTGQEALAAFFKGVGDHFMDMASQMIAKLIEIYILETVLGFITGAVTSGSFQSKSNAAGKATFGGSFKGTGASTFGAGGTRVPGYAEGGFVTGPTRAVIGEGGEAEYVIPASKMRGAMSRYASGARGSAVIPAGGDTEGGGTATMAPASIDVRYTVERINSVDYVTADQFQSGLQQAAAQGAERGQQLALRRLQQSPSTRRRVGI